MEHHWNPGVKFWKFYRPIPFQRMILTFLAAAGVGSHGLALISLLFEVKPNDREERMSGGNRVAGTLAGLWMKHKAIRDQPDGSQTDP